MIAPTSQSQEEKWEDPYPKKKWGLFPWIGAAFLTAAFYVLSIGPVSHLYDKGFISAQTLETIYKPLFRLSDSWRPFRHALGWYVDLWW